MRATQFVSLFRIQRCMNTAENNPRAAVAELPPELQAAKRIGSMNPNADHVAWLNAVQRKGFESFIDQDGIAIFRWSRRREYKQPPWRNHPNAKRHVTRIDQVNLQVHVLSSEAFRQRWR